MLVLTPPVLRLDTAAYDHVRVATDVARAWGEHARNEATYRQWEPKARQKLIAERSSMMDKLLRRTPTIDHHDLLDEIRRMAGDMYLRVPEIHLAVLRDKHPAMAAMSSADAQKVANEDGKIAMLAAFALVGLTSSGVDVLTARRNQSMDRFIGAVTDAEAALRDRRFTGFWDAVVAATTSAAEAANADRCLALLAVWWRAASTGAADVDWSAVSALLRTIVAIVGVPKEGMPVRLADGSIRHGVLLQSDISDPRSFVKRAAPVLRGDSSIASIAVIDAPLTIVADPVRAAAMADAHERFSAALLAADKDYELAMIGQQYRLRETIVESTLRLEQAIGRMGAMLAAQMRSNAAMLGARITANTAAVQEAAGAAATANARLVGAVQQAADRIDVSVQRIPAGWRVA